MTIKKGILYLILLASIAGATYATINIYHYLNEYKVAEKKYEQLSTIYEQQTEINKKDMPTHHVATEDVESELFAINEDYVGWITVEGTDVNYPVVLGNDNDYYLDRNFYKEADKVGAIFMDYRHSRDTLGKNTIIYGHNMRDNSMFSSLVNILNDPSNIGKTINLEFQGNVYEWEVVTAYKTRNTNWMQVEFTDDNDYMNYLKELNIESEKSPIEEKKISEDKIITLATCTTHIRDERIVVQGKLIKEE